MLLIVALAFPFVPFENGDSIWQGTIESFHPVPTDVTSWLVLAMTLSALMGWFIFPVRIWIRHAGPPKRWLSTGIWVLTLVTLTGMATYVCLVDLFGPASDTRRVVAAMLATSLAGMALLLAAWRRHHRLRLGLALSVLELAFASFAAGVAVSELPSLSALSVAGGLSVLGVQADLAANLRAARTIPRNAET